MTVLPPTTRRRLKKIPQSSAVWEGDRRTLGMMASHLDTDLDADSNCIIWVDGSEGAVRAMDVVAESMGMEAIVRTLLRAIESPHHPSQPCRPQKIVVRDREIQFFLRGALQDLDINIEYVPDLPLIDRLFQGFDDMGQSQPPALPVTYEHLINSVAVNIWEEAPWELLADSDILCVELKGCEIERIYLCVMGMMSAEYGVLLYRSLESLKQFRSAALGTDKHPAELEKAFLSQDCWFLNYEEVDESERYNEDPDILEITPVFGSLHPYEGMRLFLDEEEAKIVFIVLDTFLRFCQRNQEKLIEEPIEKIVKSYRINIPSREPKLKYISTKVSTLPDLTLELLEIGDSSNFIASEKVDVPIQEDLIPNGSLVTLSSIPGNLIEKFKQQDKTYYQALDFELTAAELPSILIQTTRPKAKTLIERIKNAGGLKAVCFNPGEDPYSGEVYDLGMLQTSDGELYIFAEYSQDVPQQLKAVKHWHKSCQKTQGHCGLVIAMGATGSNRGNPQPKDMLALFEVKAVNGQELGMGMLKLMPNFEF